MKCGRKKTSFGLRPLLSHTRHLAAFSLLGRLPLVSDRATAGMCTCVCFCESLFVCVKETQECGSMQTRAPAFMFISLSGEGECLSQEVGDVSLSQCLRVCGGPIMVGRFFCFSERRCYMLSLTDGSGGGNDSNFLLFLLIARLLLLQSECLPCCFPAPQKEQSTVGRDTQSSQIPWPSGSWCLFLPV